MPSSGKTGRRRKGEDLFDASGQTEAERRELRKKQRTLYDRIAQDDRQEGEEEEDEFLANVRDKNNLLFKKVKFTREAVLDAENCNLIAQKKAQQADRLIQVARYDAMSLANKMRSKYSSSGDSSSRQLDWVKFGAACGVCFNALPTNVRFLAGSLDVEEEAAAKQKRKARQRRVNLDNVEETSPEQVSGKEKEGGADRLSAVEKSMKKLKKTLHGRCVENYNAAKEEASGQDEAAKQEAEDHGEECDGVQFLFNPKSFTQTVENIFHFSFLVKKGEGGIGVRTKEEASQFKRPGLYVYEAPDDQDKPVSTQSVVSFTMQDWRDLCQSHNLREGDLKHRTGSGQAKKVKHEEEDEDD